MTPDDPTMEAVPAAASPAEAPAPAAPARRRDAVTLSIVSSLVLLVAIVLANVALARTTVRLDLTEERLFTLSDATRKVLHGLSDSAAIRVYWGTKIPETAEPVQRRLRGLLEEYESASEGRLKVEWVDMSGAEGEKEAADKGIAEQQFQVMEASKLSVAKAYDGLTIAYEDKTEVVGPLAESNEDQTQYQIAADLEYRLTSTLWKMSRTSKPVVGFVRDDPAPNFMNPRGGGGSFSILGSEVLEKTFGSSLKSYLSLDDPIPPDVMVLLVAAPKDLSEKKAYHVEQFLLRGGKVLLLLDGVNLQSAWGGAPPTKSGLEDWLKAAGVEIPDGVVADYGDRMQSFAVTREGQGVPYPYWIQLRSAFLDTKNPAFRNVDGIPLYWAQEIVADPAKQQAAGRTLSVLATTGEHGYRRPDLRGLEAPDGPEGKVLGKKTVMVMLEGKFTSYWKGKPAPDAPPPEPLKPPEAPAMDAEPPAMGAEPSMGADPAAPPAVPPVPVPVPLPGMDAKPPSPAVPAGSPTPPASPPPAPPAMQPEPAMTPGADGSDGSDGSKGSKGSKGAKGARGPEGAEGDKGPPKPPRLDEGKGVLVILGDAGLVSDEFSGTRKDMTGGATRAINGVRGFAFVANVVDWMTGSEDVIALRSRGAKSRKLDEVGEDGAKTIRWANFLIAPLAVALAGFLVYFVRRYRS